MILEKLLAAIEANTAALNAMRTGAAPATVNTPATNGLGAPMGSAQLGSPATPPPPSDVDGDKIMALIQPHVHVPAIKEDLGTAMRALGVNALPETPPHLFGPMYQAFQAVIAKHTMGGTAAAPAPQNVSII